MLVSSPRTPYERPLGVSLGANVLYGTDLIALGYVFAPDNPVRIEINYLLPAAPASLEDSSALSALQVAL